MHAVGSLERFSTRIFRLLRHFSHTSRSRTWNMPRHIWEEITYEINHFRRLREKIRRATRSIRATNCVKNSFLRMS